jgi:heat shock protein HslJ
MKLAGRLSLLAVAVLAPLSAADAQRAQGKTQEELMQEQKYRPPDKVFPLGAVWVLRDLNGKPIPSGIEATLVLDKNNRGSGSSGCNTWSSPMMSVPGQKFAMGAIAMTRKACPAPVMAFERSYLQTLHSGPTWDIVGPDLIVKTASTTLRFSRGL